MNGNNIARLFTSNDLSDSKTEGIPIPPIIRPKSEYT